MAYIGKQPTPVPLTSEDIADGIITNTDIATNAAIAQAKISNLTTDLGGKQPLDAGLTSISGLTTDTDKMIYTTAADTYAVADLTSAGRALLDDADATAQRTTLGLSNFADLTADQTFTAANRGTITADNDGSFDLAVTNNFSCTPVTGTTAVTLTFTNIASAAGQTGNIILDNGTANGGQGATYSLATNTIMNSSEQNRLSAAKKFWLSYFCDGTNVYVTASVALN